MRPRPRRMVPRPRRHRAVAVGVGHQERIKGLDVLQNAHRLHSLPCYGSRCEQLPLSRHGLFISLSTLLSAATLRDASLVG
jgi:hypothetical protein